MSKLQESVFVVRDNKVVKLTYKNLDNYIVTTPRPSGVGTEYYVTTDNNDDWCVALYKNGIEKVISVHASETDAISAVEDEFITQIHNNNDEIVFVTHAAALESIEIDVEAVK